MFALSLLGFPFLSRFSRVRLHCSFFAWQRDGPRVWMRYSCVCGGTILTFLYSFEPAVIPLFISGPGHAVRIPCACRDRDPRGHEDPTVKGSALVTFWLLSAELARFALAR